VAAPGRQDMQVINAALHPAPAHSLSHGDSQGISFSARSFDLSDQWRRYTRTSGYSAATGHSQSAH